MPYGAQRTSLAALCRQRQISMLSAEAVCVDTEQGGIPMRMRPNPNFHASLTLAMEAPRSPHPRESRFLTSFLASTFSQSSQRSSLGTTSPA